tara:strand:- start:8 stop:346 length:339 start_codon:yes stop_codon:yes gene_type:complete
MKTENKNELVSKAQKEVKTTKENKEPVANFPEIKFRAGAISATVWSNKAIRANGEEAEYKTISIDRNYTDQEGKWQSTNSLRANDLPKACLVLQKAYEHVVFSKQQLFKNEN